MIFILGTIGDSTVNGERQRPGNPYFSVPEHTPVIFRLDKYHIKVIIIIFFLFRTVGRGERKILDFTEYACCTECINFHVQSSKTKNKDTTFT